MDKGLLGELLKCCNNKPYEFEAHANGLKVVRGKTVKMDVFDTGDPTATAYYQELVSKEESHMSAGFLVIDHSEFAWELTYEEIDYVIEGTLTVTIDGKKYGDLRIRRESFILPIRQTGRIFCKEDLIHAGTWND